MGANTQVFFYGEMFKDPSPLNDLEDSPPGDFLGRQVVYLIIATDPVRYRPLMLTGVLAKGSYATAVAILFLQGRVAAPMATSALFDLTLAVLFALAYVKTASGKARAA